MHDGTTTRKKPRTPLEGRTDVFINRFPLIGFIHGKNDSDWIFVYNKTTLETSMFPIIVAFRVVGGGYHIYKQKGGERLTTVDNLNQLMQYAENLRVNGKFNHDKCRTNQDNSISPT